MQDEHKELIKKFFIITDEMKSKGIIRSSKYSGDIAEYIACNIFNLTLSTSQREKGIDATDENFKYEIKFHNGASGTNIQLDKYKENIEFDFMYVLLGKDSNLRDKDNPKYEDNFILIYKFSKVEVEGIIKDGNNINKSNISSKIPIKKLDCNLEEIR